jgi:hypothetical protein
MVRKPNFLDSLLKDKPAAPDLRDGGRYMCVRAPARDSAELERFAKIYNEPCDIVFIEADGELSRRLTDDELAKLMQHFSDEEILELSSLEFSPAELDLIRQELNGDTP